MGNKIITEKDFWICSEGCMPAQLQGTREGLKKKGGEIYITVADKATSSWIDFSCKKMMLLMAIAVAVVVVIVAATVVTGGAALIAIGAIAGAVGATIGAIEGALICGQKGAGLRNWTGSKGNMIIQSTDAITGDHKMICKAGGIVTFAPQIKSWSQAIALGASNYLSGIFEGMMAGACIGGIGAAVVGGSSAVAAGGARGLGQAALNFVRTMPKNFVVNIAESFGKFGLALRGVMGAQNAAATYGNTGSAGVGDFLKGTVAMETGAYDSAKNIATTGGSWQDWAGMALMFSPVGAGKRQLEEGIRSEPDAPGNKTDDANTNNDAETNRGDEEGTTRTEVQDAEQPRQGEDGNAYEAPVVRTNLMTGDPPFRRNPKHDAVEFQRQIEGQEAGMNNLTVEDFLNNRDAYLENGRSTEGSTAQQRYREQFREGMIDDLMENEGLSYDEAATRTDDYMSDKAALHDPDQIAGGHGTNITGLGNTNINSSIGSQWKTRIDAIDAQVREQAAGMTPEQRANTYLNISLPWE